MNATRGLTRSFKPLVIRLAPEMRKLLEGQASFKGMSMNMLINSILEEHAYRSVDIHDRLSRLESDLAAMQLDKRAQPH
ncbi:MULTISPECIES: hypothetical protein [Labrys]|jgi:hypothetical protein|uniref:hypothetical protein n=1 Tax=Labrys TaxID=204476 RepID=UPI0008351189|nr:MULTISPECIES: hypothetical protein [unclassified Labrys (in: a-proteobacteria)]MDZ5452101.1 hypothetical protein [Labrys sp. ZIDIC5]OCC06970.1 hypothetical protein BA190_01745 [Labrys sp. WJW]